MTVLRLHAIFDFLYTVLSFCVALDDVFGFVYTLTSQNCMYMLYYITLIHEHELPAVVLLPT